MSTSRAALEALACAGAIGICGVVGTAAITHHTPFEVSVRLSDHLSEQHAGVFVALANHIYQDASLSVRVSPRAANLDPVRAVADQFDQMGAAPSWDVVRARCNGASLVPLAVDLTESPVEWVALKRSGIREFADLKHKRVGVGRNGEGLFVLQAVARRIGLPLSSMTLIPVGDDLQHLSNNVVDALLVRSAHAHRARVALGLALNEPLRASDYGVRPYGQVLFTTEEYMALQPHRVREFLSSTRAGWRLVRQDPVLASSLVEGRAEFAHTTKAELIECFRGLMTYIPATVAESEPDPVRFVEVADLLAASGEVSYDCAEPELWKRQVASHRFVENTDRYGQEE